MHPLKPLHFHDGGDGIVHFARAAIRVWERGGNFLLSLFLFLKKQEEVIIVVVVVDIDCTKEFKYNIITKITKIVSDYAYNGVHMYSYDGILLLINSILY